MLASTESVPRAHGRLLIVSGQKSPGQELRRVLETRGFDVRLALTASEALERARNWHPSVILIDLDFDEWPEEPVEPAPVSGSARTNGRSDRSAFALCQRLRSTPDGRLLPVLYLASEELSGAPDPWLEGALRSGGSDFVVWNAPPLVLQARIFQHVRLHETQARLRMKSIRDELTGLYSGQFLMEHLRQLLGALVVHPERFTSLAFLRIDVDGFPELSRQLTPLQYESLLVMVGEIVREHCRAELVARVAQDKYAVLLPGVAEKEVMERAESARLAVERETALEFPATISIGVACFESAALAEVADVDAVINRLHKHASLGLQQAQGFGGNQISIYHEPTTGERRRDRRWEVDVRVELLGRYGVREARAATDLSTGGVALDGVADLKIGDHVELLIHLGEEVVGGTGVVAWCGTIPGFSQRCGIAFESLAGDGQEVLRRFLDERARRLSEESENAGANDDT